MKRFRSISPYDQSILGTIKVSDSIEIGEKVALARAATIPWKDFGVVGRVDSLRKAFEIFSLRKKDFSEMISQEMGMPVTQSQMEVDDALGFFQWYLDNAAQYLAPEVTFQNNQEVHTVYKEPYGVAAIIAPWNYPFSTFVWQCIQNLLAGNTVVFKHSEESPLVGQLIEKAFEDAALPKGVFNEIYGRGSVGTQLARQPVNLICFTGSTSVGESLYRIASQDFKKILMELGGSAPGIVFEDADLDQIAGQIYSARFSNAGQMCDALKRLIVHENIMDPVIEKLSGKLQMVTLGDPLNKVTTMGPLVSKNQADLLERQVADAVEKGAMVVTGGKKGSLGEAYYEPTLLTSVNREMRVWQEETFGPVLPIVTFKTEIEAINLANDTRYGLGGYIYTKDLSLAERVAEQLQTGMVSINSINYVRPQNPFGGYKYSGLGREHGRWGFEDVTQVKVVSKPNK